MRRVQLEIGVRWQMVPDRHTTWKKWAFDPYWGAVWPGKIIRGRQDLPEGEVFGGLEITDKNEYRALVWWVSGAIRVLGLDVGLGVFVRSKESVAKLLSGGKCQ